MADRVILCSQCGTKNRVPTERAGTPRCGGCGKTLHVANRNSTRRTWITVVVVLVTVSAGAALVIGFQEEEGFGAVRTSSPPPTRQTTSPPPTTALAPPLRFAPPLAAAPAPPAVPITTGLVVRPIRGGVAPFEVVTPAGRNYYVKLVDMTGQTILSMYIAGGRSFETLVPLGLYEVRYASGNTWYGTTLLFGSNTSYSETTKTFRFYETPTQYMGHTVELIAQVGGNLDTRTIRPEDF